MNTDALYHCCASVTSVWRIHDTSRAQMRLLTAPHHLPCGFAAWQVAFSVSTRTVAAMPAVFRLAICGLLAAAGLAQVSVSPNLTSPANQTVPANATANATSSAGTPPSNATMTNRTTFLLRGRCKYISGTYMTWDGRNIVWEGERDADPAACLVSPYTHLAILSTA